MTTSPSDTTLVFVGRTVSVNRWHGATVVRGSKTRAHLYEKAVYREFKERLSLLWRASCPMYEGKVDLEIFLCMHERKDTDGPLKPIIDSLKGIAYKDDTQVRHIQVTRAYHAAKEDDTVVLIIRPVTAPYGSISIPQEVVDGRES